MCASDSFLFLPLQKKITQYILFPLPNCAAPPLIIPHDHLPLFALGFTDSELLLQQLHSLGQLLVPEAEAVHLLLLLPQALVPLLQLLLTKTTTNMCRA